MVIERITNPEIQNLFFFFFRFFFNSNPGFFLFSFFFECVFGGGVGGCRVRRQGARGEVARGVGAFFLKRELLYQPNTH